MNALKPTYWVKYKGIIDFIQVTKNTYENYLNDIEFALFHKVTELKIKN
jgi:hypothetical protein